jgi:lysophospholipid acyltransferase (LPLAT)-like uncharacterized protein
MNLIVSFMNLFLIPDTNALKTKLQSYKHRFLGWSLSQVLSHLGRTICFRTCFEKDLPQVAMKENYAAVPLHAPAAWVDIQPKIFAVWHGNQICYPYSALKKKLGTTQESESPKMCVIISQHTDGRIAASAVENFNFVTVAGSSSKGGARALINLINYAKKGYNIVITIDGPKGPIYQVKSGVIKLAESSGLPIVPLYTHCSSFYQLKSWDRMMIPKPFSKCIVFSGNEITVPKKASPEILEVLRLTLEERLHLLKNKATSFFSLNLK